MKRLLSRPHLNFSTLNQSKGKIQDIRKIFHPKCFQINHSGRLAKNYFWVFLGRALQCWCSHVCGRCIHNTFSQHYPLAQWRSPSIFSGLNYDYTYDSKWMKTKHVKSDPKDTTVAPKTFLGEKSPPLAAVLHQRCECSKTHGVLAVGNFSILKRGLFRYSDIASSRRSVSQGAAQKTAGAFLFFSSAVFCAAPWKAERLEEANSATTIYSIRNIIMSYTRLRNNQLRFHE